MTRIAPRNLIPLYADRAWSDAELALQVGVDRTTVFKARRARRNEHTRRAWKRRG